MKTRLHLRLLSVAVGAAMVCIAPRLFSADAKPGVEFSWTTHKAPSGNAAIMAYLGDPVTPPADVDAKYTPEGLKAAFATLCNKLGCTASRVGIDDSEFPFLIYGVFDRRLEHGELQNALKTMPGYTYSGSTTGRSGETTYFSLNIMPHSAYPQEKAEAIHRRLMIRMQMLGAVWRDVPSR